MMSAGSSYDRFATTRWSVVLQLASAEPPVARAAIVELVQRYWHAVYAYVRHCGHAPPIAQDISHCFLSSLMRQFSDGQTQPSQTHFRHFLLDQLNVFLGGDSRDIVDGSGADELVAPVDLEVRFQRNNAKSTSPERTFQHSFALEVISRALRRLQSEASQTGHAAMFRTLEPHLASDPGPGDYDAMAATLGSRPLALVVALKHLRQRFRELVCQELADTVTSTEELTAEQAALHAILRETHAHS